MTDWEIRGREIANCNCNFGCPCQFGVLPSTGDCQAVVGFEIDRGHHGETDLAGVRMAGVYKWPGPIHEGDGHMQIVVDEGASDAQAAAIEAIMTGQDTDEMATFWWVYANMSPHKHPTLRARIEFESDAGAREGRVRADGVFETAVVPIPNIVSGEPHRIAINLPHGFEFDRAEVAKGSTSILGGDVAPEGLDASHAHFAELHLTGRGVVRDAA